MPKIDLVCIIFGTPNIILFPFPLCCRTWPLLVLICELLQPHRKQQYCFLHHHLRDYHWCSWSCLCLSLLLIILLPSTIFSLLWTAPCKSSILSPLPPKQFPFFHIFFFRGLIPVVSFSYNILLSHFLNTISYLRCLFRNSCKEYNLHFKLPILVIFLSRYYLQAHYPRPIAQIYTTL